MTQEIFIVNFKDFIILVTIIGYGWKKKKGSILGGVCVCLFIYIYTYIHVGIDIKSVIFFYNEV